jgi:aminopeptidase N
VRNLFRLFLSLTLLFATPLAGIADDGGDTQLPDFEERARQLYGDQPVLSPPRTPSAHEIQVLASQDEFDVTRYFLDLTFDELSETLDGSVEVTATSLVDGLQTVTLDLQGNMNVTSVTQGIPLLPFVHNGNFLDVTLPAPVDSGQSFTFKVFYNGSPVTSSNYFGWNKYLGSGQGEMVWSLSEPYGARLWWPCKDRPDDKAEVEEWWTINYRWTATGNGVLAGSDSLPGAKTRFRWVATNPLPTYLVSIAASRYSWFSDTYTPIAGGSMPIDYYVYPEDLADAQLSFSETPAMIEVYADLFGEYPFVDDKYGMSAFPFGGAMEHSTNTSYGYNLINGSHNYDFIIAHELAHQWWGDSVSPESWPNIWLNEGFASYSEALWFEHLGGATDYHSYMAGLYSSSFSGPLYDPNYLFSSTVYDKGAWVLHMLRGVMGDTAFFQGLRDWYTGHQDGTGNTQQFQATVEVLYGDSLTFFFQQWVYNANRPRYEYGYTTADLGTGSFRNYVRIVQTQSNAGVFTMPIDLTLSTSSGSEVRTVWNDAGDQDFVLDTTEPLIGLLLDDDDWILKGTVTQITLVDGDGDGVPDRNDNCPVEANEAQDDLDADLQGDACDDDDDGDSLADEADCAPLDPEGGVPDAVALLTLVESSGQPTMLSWTPAIRADAYDLVRGPIGSLSTGYGTCLAPLLPGLSYDDSDVSPAGEGYAYLVRGNDTLCGGGGSIGTDSAGAPRTSPCP